MANWTEVARVTEIPVGTGKTIKMDGSEIALFNADGQFYALDNACPHKGLPLADGPLLEGYVSCPWHAWEFNLETGENRFNPECRLRTYPVEVAGDSIRIQV